MKSTFDKFCEVAFIFSLCLMVGLLMGSTMSKVIEKNVRKSRAKDQAPTLSYSEDLFMATPMYGWPHQVDVLD